MKLGIRAKFIGILVIASIVPLTISILAIQVLGYHYYQREKGKLYESVAIHLSQSLNVVINSQLEKLNDWLMLSDVGEMVEQANANLPQLSEEEFNTKIVRLEERWPRLKEQDPELHAILNNPIARKLKAYQSVNPLFAEIFVTDKKGQLLAATNKTTDYWQADEHWWRNAYRVAPRQAYVEGINFDESAGVYSVDVALPILNLESPDSPPLGILKGVIDGMPLFSSVPKVLADEHPHREVVDEDGDILFRLFSPSVVPHENRLSNKVIQKFRRQQAGWMFADVNGEGIRLVGFSAMRLSGFPLDDVIPAGARPLYVIVHEDADIVLAPVRKQLWIITGGGVIIVLGFSLIGMYVANRKIIAPIQLLRSATQAVASSAKLDESASAEEEVTEGAATGKSVHVLHEVKQIQTADEIEDLARDFKVMAKRVLQYHEQLEDEIAIKTAEIQRDLHFAREFQQALMPSEYPQVPSTAGADPLALNFHHIYKAASSVGGDFFDVLKLSDHKAGIFIADVMGHGARSALVTAILRTLLQGFSKQGDDPVKFLSLINQHFYDLIQQSEQFVFVSAFYLIIDTQKAIATYASAGHPSPLLADRTRKKVTPVIHHLEDNPALGLFREATYTGFTSFVKKDDVFLLFTDGVFEAINPEGEEFGHERLCKVLEQNMDVDVNTMSQKIIDAVTEFIGSAALPDDICLVAVEVVPSSKTPVATTVEAAATT